VDVVEEASLGDEFLAPVALVEAPIVRLQDDQLQLWRERRTQRGNAQSEQPKRIKDTSEGQHVCTRAGRPTANSLSTVNHNLDPTSPPQCAHEGSVRLGGM